ncbi:probable cytochrome P450 6a13 isoform X2 [Halyomorpha halys]|nr:probable cytochrome P450 6a13 isoform X2 [Halyomorpha halys]
MVDVSITLYFWFFTTAIICILLGVTYEYFKKRYRYWSDIGIPGPKPTFIVGNMKETLFLKCTEPEMTDEWYKDYRDKPYVGFYNFLKPSLFIIDPELIRKITEVDFNHFIDHPPFSDAGHSDNDAIMYSLFTMNGENWKLKRSIFSKLFTPKKLREQVEIFNHRYSSLKEEIEGLSEGSKDADLSKLVGRYILMGFGTILYGIDLTKDEQLFENLEKYSAMFLHPKFYTTLMFLFYTASPELFNYLRMKTFSSDFWDYFSPFTKKLLEYNKSPENIYRSGLVSLISQNQDLDSPSAIGHREAVGHIFSFLSASNHTTLTTVNYGLFLLAQHPQVQDKLRDEVDRVMKKNEELTIENIQDMAYLDAVLNETMRLYPLLGILKRICTKEYHVDDRLTIPKGTDIFIPVQSINMDPEYFQEPETFHPERFLNLEKLPSFFMPFGKGPRNCIGLRMAAISFKIAVARIISDFIILPSPKTTLPIKFDRKALFITCTPEDGLWVKFQKRDIGQ